MTAFQPWNISFVIRYVCPKESIYSKERDNRERPN
jgi:hypothetical protein